MNEYDDHYPLSTTGRFIVDASGSRVRLAGVNWFGAHEDNGVPAGLDRVHWGDRAVNGLLTQDWNGVANPTVLASCKPGSPARRSGRELTARL